VVFLKRPGGQGQFSVPLSLQASDDARFDGLHDWVQGHLGGDLRVEALAERVGMSPRSFARLYLDRTGRTPAKVVEAFRLEAARRALEDTQQSLKAIAIQCGF
jgi:transcriptional regulator GlxA family with amidase domain